MYYKINIYYFTCISYLRLHFSSSIPKFLFIWLFLLLLKFISCHYRSFVSEAVTQNRTHNYYVTSGLSEVECP